MITTLYLISEGFRLTPEFNASGFSEELGEGLAEGVGEGLGLWLFEGEGDGVGVGLGEGVKVMTDGTVLATTGIT